MVAHLDAVTCLAVDPNGVFLMSGSKLLLRSQGMCLPPLAGHPPRGSARWTPKAGGLGWEPQEQEERWSWW